MGKSKRKTKLSSLRAKNWPILSSGADKADVETIGDHLLSEIQTKLKSGKPMERHLASDMIANSMANFDNYSDKQLVQLIRTLSPICADRVENCRNSAIDSLWLCYLSSISDKLCDLMVGSDVMTPLLSVFHNFFATNLIDWTQKPKSEQILQIYVNSCRLLTNLCGISDKALKIFNNSNVIQILINGLKGFEVNFEVAIASAQCLSVVSEENRIPELLIAENIELIKKLMEKSVENLADIHLNVLMAFIAINLELCSEPTALELVFKLIDQSLTTLPDIQSFADVIQQVLQFVDNQKNIDLLKQKYFELKNILLAKRVALELVTNITSAEDISGSDEEMDCDEEDMDASDDDEPIGGHCLTNTVDNQTSISSDLEKIILEKSLINKIGEHLVSVDQQLSQILLKHNFGKEILNCIQSIHLCSLTCIHNLVESISTEKLQINEKIWKHIYNIAFDCNLSPNSTQLAEESTNTMRAIITRNVKIGLTADELERLCICCQKYDSIAVKINVINLMSVLTQRSIDLEFIEKITVLLMAGLQNESNLVIRAEIFDALIDIFSEDHKTDSIALKLDLINRMKVSAILFKKEANRSPDSKRNPIISTVKLNLMPFIKYKQKILNKLKN